MSQPVFDSQSRPTEVSACNSAETSVRQALEHRERQIEAMSRLSAAMFTHRGVDALVRETLTIAVETVGADAGSLQMHDASRDQLVFRYVVGAAAERLLGFTMPASEGISGRVFRTGEPDIASDVRERPDFNRATQRWGSAGIGDAPYPQGAILTDHTVIADYCATMNHNP